MKNKWLIGAGIVGAVALSGCQTNPQVQDNGASTASSSMHPAHSNDQRYIDARYTTIVDSHLKTDNRPMGSTNTVVVLNPHERERKQRKDQQQDMMAQQSAQRAPMHNQRQARQERIKITAVGYGAENTYEGFTDGQRRLMAIRASKLDAYRALAEQIYGIQIDSNTSVATLTAQSDSFRARVNAVVRGARIVSITPMSDNNYETVLEVFVDRRFFEEVFVYTGGQYNTVIDPIETCTMGFNCYEAANYR